jgi:hypothetical protein
MGWVAIRAHNDFALSPRRAVFFDGSVGYREPEEKQLRMNLHLRVHLRKKMSVSFLRYGTAAHYQIEKPPDARTNAANLPTKCSSITGSWCSTITPCDWSSAVMAAPVFAVVI